MGDSELCGDGGRLVADVKVCEQKAEDSSDGYTKQSTRENAVQYHDSNRMDFPADRR